MQRRHGPPALIAATEPRQAAATPSRAYLALTFPAFCGLLAWACAIPHLPAP